MKKRCVFAVSMALAAGLPLAGLAVEYFADAVNGSDSYDGTAAKWAGGESTVGPKKTVQAAVNLADGNGTIITLLPGVYDEGGAENTGNYPQSNRVVITKSNVTIRSSTGKAKDVHILGRLSTAEGNWYGVGEGAMRCLAINKSRAGAVAVGITFRNGAAITTDNKYRGGGIWGNNQITIIDCVVSNCVANYGGGANSTTAHSSIFIDNYARYGSAMYQSSMANCLIIHNRVGSNKSVVDHVVKAVNCTIARNGNNDSGTICQSTAPGLTDGVSSSIFYNTLVFGHRGGNHIAATADAYASVFEGNGTITAHYLADDVVTDAVAEEECASPILDDWRPLSTGHCANRGVGAYLGFVPLPEGYTYHDMAGNVIDTNGTVTVGAYQEVVTPAAARILLISSGYEVAGARYPFCSTGEWITPLAWPVVYRFRWAVPGVTYALYVAEEYATGTDRNFYHAQYDGWTSIVPWKNAAATNTLTRQSLANTFYVDAEKGDDSYDGTAAEPAGGGSLVGPKKTLQAAADTNAAITGYTFVYVAPGTYDAGGSLYNSCSNRVYDCNRPVGFIASGGPGTATIVGAPDPDTKGLGNNAMRCVNLYYKYSFMQGFNITGGFTRDVGNDTNGGGGVNCATDLAQLLDCNIVSNTANWVGGVSRGTLIRCKIMGNTAARAAAVRGSTLYRCLVDGNIGPSKIIDACRKVDSCTIGPTAKKADGGTASQVLYNTESPVVNSLVLAPSFVGTTTHPPQATNCVFVIKWSTADADTGDCIFTNMAAVAYDENYRPIVGANVGIDRADESLSSPSWLVSGDLSGAQSVMNGVRDLGALEADWRPKYAEDLGGRCTVTTVSPEVRENAEGHIYLPSGSLEGAFAASSKASRRKLGVRVTGTGTLTVTVAGEVVGEFTANGGDVQNSTLKLSTAGDAFSFAYVPGKNDVGGAEIVECSRLVGSSIVIR